MLSYGEPVNSGRQHEFDIFRTINVFMMIGTHVLENILVSLDSPLAEFYLRYDNLYAGATVFMFLMGMSMAYSHHTEAADLLKRGVMILTFGWVLNLLRNTAGNLVLLAADKIEIGMLADAVSGDIMQLAGLSFVLMAFFRKKRISSRNVFFISIGMNLLGTALAGHQSGWYPLDQILGYFWGTYTESFFPLFYWFIIIAAGQCFGEFYLRLKDKKQWHIRTVPAGLILSAAYIIISNLPQQRIFHITDEPTGLPWMRLPDVIGCLIVAVTGIGLIYLISKGREVRLCRHVSENVNRYYCISWVLILWCMVIMRVSDLTFPESDPVFIVANIGVCFLSFLILTIYRRCFEKRWTAFFGRHKTFWICLVWIATFCVAAAGFMLGDEYPNMFNGYLEGLRV